MPALRVILPDQLHHDLVKGFVSAGDAVLIAETGYLFRPHVHARKLTLLASAGRHFAAALREAGARLDHRTIARGAHRRPLSEHVVEAARDAAANSVVAIRPGSWSELDELERAAGELGVGLEIQEDPHFFSTPGDFAEHAEGRKRLVMEYFYRELRKRHDVLMEETDAGFAPAGGQWNFDSDNRESFGRGGPGEVPRLPAFAPDEVTRQAASEVAEFFPDAPGEAACELPVTPGQAREALGSFIRDRLPDFGRYQDAMWAGEPFLYHSILSPALNLRLLDPHDVVAAAERAWSRGEAPLNSVEGFVRQIIGWREFVRGVYFHRGPRYLEENALGAEASVPDFYWNGRTEMACVRDVMAGVLRAGYAHHIQRLMVMGLYAMQAGVDPRRLHEWHLALYLDAYDWVSAPNVIGMSQYADGGFLATKPYAASGRYIRRMSNYCGDCRFDPENASGENACPFTTLYWDFLLRHEDELRDNRRMAFQLKNLERKSADEREAIRSAASTLRSAGC
jgi:deoxyribodipyrimidine photolyase-related protein